MDFLPLFFDLKQSHALVFGSSSAAIRKAELLCKASCQVSLIGEVHESHIQDLLSSLNVSLVAEETSAMWDKANLIVAATGDAGRDQAIAQKAKQRKIPVNVVNDASSSNFVFPSVIDRSPVIAAVSSSGELPVLTRLLRSQLESSIPHAFGRMAELAKNYRARVKQTIPDINRRRRFWEQALNGRFANLVYSGKEAEAESTLQRYLEKFETAETKVGEVYLVGAGPGDPDLLTFKALRLMRQADVVLYDRLVSPEIMKLVRQDAELINVGKERAKHTLPQDSINDLLVKLAQEGKRVLRLKGGDPFIFGRGGEEIERLSEFGVPFEVVPGITAASGCAAYAGIPLTHRDYSQSVRFITGHLKDNSCALPWHEFVHPNQTLVFYMGLQGLPVITNALVNHGMSAETPIALVSKGTTRDQRVLVSDLKGIVALANQEAVRAPTLIIIGEVVRLHDKLNWLDQSVL